jgi:hypothetical protein
MGPILNMVDISCNVEGVSCEELGWPVNLCLLRPFTAPIRAYHFASSVVTLWAIKLAATPCVNLLALARHPIVSSPPSLRLKRKER